MKSKLGFLATVTMVATMLNIAALIPQASAQQGTDPTFTIGVERQPSPFEPTSTCSSGEQLIVIIFSGPQPISILFSVENTSNFYFAKGFVSDPALMEGYYAALFGEPFDLVTMSVHFNGIVEQFSFNTGDCDVSDTQSIVVGDAVDPTDPTDPVDPADPDDGGTDTDTDTDTGGDTGDGDNGTDTDNSGDGDNGTDNGGDTGDGDNGTDTDNSGDGDNGGDNGDSENGTDTDSGHGGNSGTDTDASDNNDSGNSGETSASVTHLPKTGSGTETHWFDINAALTVMVVTLISTSGLRQYASRDRA